MTRRKTQMGEARKWLHDHASFEGDHCLIWPYMRDKNGYGLVAQKYRQDRKRKKHFAHRLMCELAHGPAPFEGAVAAHRVCENGAGGCVNPNHIRWATRAENQKDRVKFGRLPVGEKNAHAKLTEKEVKEIRKKSAQGKRDYALAREYGVDPSTISLIKTRKRWRHVT